MARSSSSSAALSRVSTSISAAASAPAFSLAAICAASWARSAESISPAARAWDSAAAMRPLSTSPRILSPPAVMASLSVAVSSADSCVHLGLRPVGFFLRGVPLLFQRLPPFCFSSSISCLRLNSPAERETLPPVNEPPALTTWPSTVTTRLR